MLSAIMPRAICFAIVLSIGVSSRIPAIGDETPPVDPYVEIWESLADLIRQREYGTASSLLNSLVDDPTYREYGVQIKADREVVSGLQALEQVVHEQAANLSVGALLEINGVKYRFVKYNEDPKGDEVVLRSEASGAESARRISTLPTSTWMQLCESKLESVKQPDLVFGVFSAFDRYPDLQVARKRFNDAANDGADVRQWLVRLEEMLKRRAAANDNKNKSEEVDPILGRWRMTVKNNGPIFDLEFRDKGTVLSVVTARPARSRRRVTSPRMNVTRGRWARDEDGIYRVTLASGVTLELRKVGDRLIGKNAGGGEVLGLRHVAK